MTTSSGAGDHRLHIALLPFAGRGHINPLLALSQHLSDRNLLVSIIVTEEWSSLLSSSSSLPPSCQLRTIPNVLPSEHVRGTEYPSFINAIFTKMTEPVEALIAQMEPRVDLIVSDVLLAWAPEMGQRIGIPVAAFFPQSATVAFALFEFARLDDGRATADDLPGEIRKLLEYIPIPEDPNPAVESSSKSHILLMTRKFVKIISWAFKSNSLLLSSFYDLERSAIDGLKSQIQTPIYPIGPLIYQNSQNETNIANYMTWLDSKSNRSVVYISMGSFISVSKEQLNEIIFGLNLSESPYLLVLRENNEENKKIIGDRGLIVSWCNQFKVLSHPSVGGFLTHCGWNSVFEAICNNIPMITFPISFDQISNSNLIVKEWRIGMKLRGVEKEEILKRENIASVVQKMMNLSGNESKEVRRNMRELHEKCVKVLEKNGCLDSSINDFVHALS
ncbi:hypothetical protein LUZ60_000954 [Juncus effusus]|nr:hypothetical protein LUZ60_000954 [Juncus effusus]